MFSCLLSKSNRFYAIHIVSFELELTSYMITCCYLIMYYTYKKCYYQITC
jgi:hypothetical protein